jgi:hypothetical protein
MSSQETEVEDVLSSIKRLVTHRANSPVEKRQNSGSMEKLLLTPSLRVVDGEALSEQVVEFQPITQPPITDIADAPDTSLEDRIAELEAAVGAETGDWEPDGSELTDLETPDRFPFDPGVDLQAHKVRDADSDVIVPAIMGTEMARGGASPEAELSADIRDRFDLAEDAVIDEEMLRDMVAEIVREELQGSLGERITRNVRKLVRREIHRAIMTRDFG